MPMPALEVGTPDRPVDAGHTALIRLVHFAGTDRQSWPAVVCCEGRMDMHGAPMNRTWVKLGATARAGASAVTLAEAGRGWRSGDRVIVSATHLPRFRARGGGLLTEERTVRKVEGTKLTLDRPLEYEHLGAGEFRGEVANLSRNVVVESAEPR